MIHGMSRGSVPCIPQATFESGSNPHCWVCGSSATAEWKARSLSRRINPNDLRITDSRYGVTLALRRCTECGFMQVHAHIGYFSRHSMKIAAHAIGMEEVGFFRARWFFPISYLAERLAVYLPVGALNKGPLSFPPLRWLYRQVIPLNPHDSVSPTVITESPRCRARFWKFRSKGSSQRAPRFGTVKASANARVTSPASIPGNIHRDGSATARRAVPGLSPPAATNRCHSSRHACGYPLRRFLRTGFPP